MMRIVAGRAALAIHLPHRPVPITAGAAMRARFPVAISRAVATAAQIVSVLNLYGAPIAGLEHFEIVLIMTIETVVVPVVSPVRHDDVAVFVGQNDFVIGIEIELQFLVPFVAAVTFEHRGVALGPIQFLC